MSVSPAGNPFSLPGVGACEGPADGPLVPELAAPRGRWESLWRALGWSATSVPVALLLTMGIALGPYGTNLLPSAALQLLDPVVPVALAALGVLVGLGVGERRPGDGRVLAAASLDAVVTMLVVAGGVALLALAGSARNGAVLDGVVLEFRPFWVLVLATGICAATSLTLPAGDPFEPRALSARLVELGVLLPGLGGALLLTWLPAGSATGTLLLVAQASGITLALAAAGWLLLTRVSSETEERVFAISALLLVGGAAAALSFSALFGGLIAGGFWRYAGRRPRETISRDVLLVQHPLLVLVLLMAGAHAEISAVTLGLGVAYLVLRVVSRLAGGRFAFRIIGDRAPSGLGLHLLRPGAFGVAFALNAASAAGAAGVDVPLLLGAVVTGSIGAEVVALLLRPRRAGVWGASLPWCSR